MSYDVHLFRKEVKEKEQASNDEDFFDSEEHFTPFTKEQKSFLLKYLLDSGYVIEKEEKDNISLGYEDDESISALLTVSGLYFSSTGDGIFEISMTASELADTGDFVKYDPQNEGWEEIM